MMGICPIRFVMERAVPDEEEPDRHEISTFIGALYVDEASRHSRGSSRLSITDDDDSSFVGRST